MRKVNIKKPKILLGIPMVLVSWEVYFGMLVGYFSAHFLSPRVKSIAFNIGKYRLHLHHWLLSLWILLLILTYKLSPLPVQFTSGFLGGLIFHGVLCYNDWYKILKKKSNLS